MLRGLGRLDVRASALTSPGFHGYEPLEDCTWTNGSALLPPSLFGVEDQVLAVGAQTLRIHVRHTTHYAIPEEQARRAA